MPGDVTQLLQAWRAGDTAARDRLAAVVYPELRQLADRQFRGERAQHTLQPTALVNEAWLRLAGLERIDWQDRAHFFAVAAQIMRHILVDHARKYQSDKRGAGAQKIPLDEVDVANQLRAAELVTLDHALDELEALVLGQRAEVGKDVFGGDGHRVQV